LFRIELCTNKWHEFQGKVLLFSGTVGLKAAKSKYIVILHNKRLQIMFKLVISGDIVAEDTRHKHHSTSTSLTTSNFLSNHFP